MSLASSVAQDIATLRARSNGRQSGCALTLPEEAVNVERKKDERSTGVHPCSDEMMGKGTGAANTHFGQQRFTGAAVDDGLCIDVLTTTHAHFHKRVLNCNHLKECKWVFKKAVAANNLLLPLGRDLNTQRKGLSSQPPFVNPLLSLNVFNYILKSANKKGWLQIMRCQKTVSQGTSHEFTIYC